MGPKTCKVCEDAKSKYKCPTCLIPYCSLPCFKKHKETPCAKPESNSEEKFSPAPAPAVNPEKTFYVDEPNEALQQSQLQSIASSSEIRNALKDEGLRKLIYKIDGSTDAENELDKAMEVQVFHLFSEKILSTICP